jgi:hypothetical protein
MFLHLQKHLQAIGFIPRALDTPPETCTSTRHITRDLYKHQMHSPRSVQAPDTFPEPLEAFGLMYCSVPVMFQFVSHVSELWAPSPFIVCTLVVYPCSPRHSRIVPFDGHFRIDLCSCLFVSGQWNDRPLSSHCSLDLVDLIPHLPFMSFLGQFPPLMYIQ